MRRAQLVLLAERGTSDNAAQFARYLLEIAAGIPVSLAAPSIFTLYQARVDLRRLAISQSRESADTNFVLERAREQGALSAAITNEPRASLGRGWPNAFFWSARSGNRVSPRRKPTPASS